MFWWRYEWRENGRILVSDQYAAIDLGSNSFHMLVVRVVDGEIHIVDKIRKRVRLAAGLTADRMLEPRAAAGLKVSSQFWPTSSGYSSRECARLRHQHVSKTG